MNKFKSLLLLSLIISNVVFTNIITAEETTPITLYKSKKISVDNSKDNINKDIAEIKDILKYIAIKQLEKDKKLSNTEKTNTKIEEDKKLSKMVDYLKSARNKTLSTTNYVINIAAKILSQKTLISLPLILALTIHYFPKLIPIEIIKKNPEIISKNIDLDIIRKTTITAQTTRR